MVHGDAESLMMLYKVEYKKIGTSIYSRHCVRTENPGVGSKRRTKSIKRREYDFPGKKAKEFLANFGIRHRACKEAGYFNYTRKDSVGYFLCHFRHSLDPAHLFNPSHIFCSIT